MSAIVPTVTRRRFRSAQSAALTTPSITRSSVLTGSFFAFVAMDFGMTD